MNLFAHVTAPRLTREDSIDSIALFNPLSAQERQELAKVADVKVYEDGEVIIEEGKTSELFYIIEEVSLVWSIVNCLFY